jgi:hypothetical protein
MTHDDDRIERLARRRAGMKMGWFIHAGVYLAVNLMLATIATMHDRNWAIYPALGWGLGLAIHGIVTFLVTGGGGLQDRLVESERRRLQAAQDRW